MTGEEHDVHERPRLHVLVVIDGLGWGGAEMLLTDFVRAARLLDLDVSVAYLHEKDGNPATARLREVGVEPVHLEVGRLVDPRSVRNVYRHVARIDPDVVHAHLGYSELLAGLGAGAHGIPVVSSIHLTRWNDSRKERLRLRLIDITRRATCSRIVAVSDAARAAYAEMNWGLRDDAVTIHNRIADRARPGTGLAIRNELGIAPDEFVVGMLSVLREGKGHRVAAEAIRTMRRDSPRVRLVIAGDGPARSDVQADVAPLGDTAIVTGHRDDVMELLDSFDVFLLPSEHEAFPTVLLEAMAASVPIVATAVGGINEIVDDGVSGRLLRPPATAEELASTLRELGAAPDVRAAMGLAGRRHFEDDYSLAGWGAELRSLYEDAIAGRPAPLQRIVRRTRGRRT